MSFAREMKRRARDSVAPLIFASLVAYFGWNATQGNLGLKAYALRQDDLMVAQANLSRVQAEYNAWETRVNALRLTHLDTDALDERARAMLNLSDPNDVVVQYAPEERLFQSASGI